MPDSTNVIDCLEERGFIDAVSSEKIRELCDKPTKVYAGFDPTADSLHLGNLVGIIGLRWFQRFGHTPVVILGGATGRIGDPSGKSLERPLLDDHTIKDNVEKIGKHFQKILDFEVENAPQIFNNDDWFKQLSFVDFLRDIGKQFRIGPMLGKESIRTRLHSEEGMSYTEFSYLLLQAYDFYHLYENHDVKIQMGGSDQWGNITAGVELIRKLKTESAFGLTFPLLTRSDGKKFGKSEEGAIWLSPQRCSPYQFYQYLFSLPDRDIPHLMRMLTFMEMDQINEIEKEMQRPNYVPNSAQNRLAKELTRLVHGDEGLEKALKATEGAKPGSRAWLSASILREIASDMPNKALSRADVIGQSYADLAVQSGLLSSKGEARRLVKNGGAYLNNEKLTDQSLAIGEKDLIDGEFLLIGAGKKKKVLIQVI